MDAIADDGFVEFLTDSHKDIHAVLRNYGFYIGSSNRERFELLDAAELVSSTGRQPLMEAGYCCDRVFLVGQGRLRVFLTGESGREVTLYYVRPGESCPVNLGAAMTGIAATADAEAETGIAAVAISAVDFRKMSQQNSVLADYVYTAAVMRFGEIITFVSEITTKRVSQRLVEYLSRKFGVSEETPPTIAATHQDIALELGTAREVVSRRLQELEAIGAVKLQRGRIRLVNRNLLRRSIA